MSVQLSVSCKLLQNKLVLKQLLQELSVCSTPISIGKANCQCGDHQLNYHKLDAVVSTFSRSAPLLSIKIWIREDQPSPIFLKMKHFNVIVDDQYHSYMDVGDAKNVLIVREVAQISDLLKCNIFEWERRCSLEHKLRKSHQKYDIVSRKQQVKEMAVLYSGLRQRKQLKNLVAFMKFRVKVYLQMLSRFFNAWMIHRYESQLERMDREIVESSALQLQSNRVLLGRCFKGWKRLTQIN